MSLACQGIAGDSDDCADKREFDPETTTPTRAVVEIIADLEGVETLELPPLYSTVNDLLGEFASNPPASGANVEITFTYEGYRITVYQTGLIEVE
ncbi:HalOD1 output domain-containing protein [Natronorubrum sp. DTA28]|uniref:HalOD1 output domain-containing protein n=1 Tax=Natronorubrum sp. DTA28 TaxID=3447019 RepID=UPI003F86AC3D